jgi:hypothetical protein
MSTKCKVIYLGLVLVISGGCRKDVIPEARESIGVYNWFTNTNELNNRSWVLKPDKSVWTWYSYDDIAYFRVFGPNGRYETSFDIRFDNMYKQGSDNTVGKYNEFASDGRGALYKFYLSEVEKTADTTLSDIRLHLLTLDNSGNPTQNISSPVLHTRPKYNHSVYGPVMSLAPDGYLIGYAYYEYDSISEMDMDSLVLLRTDRSVNTMARSIRAFSDLLDPDVYSYPNVVSLIAAYNRNLLVYSAQNLDYEYDYVLEILDGDLNLVKQVTPTDVASGMLDKTMLLSNPIIEADKIVVFGQKQETKKDCDLTITTLDLSGNLTGMRTIKTKMPYASLKGVEKTGDGKYLLYYTQSDIGPNEKLASVGVCKVDASGNVDYMILFPENDFSGYAPCMAFENSDGTIQVYAKKNSTNPGAQQVISVKVTSEGIIK